VAFGATVYLARVLGAEYYGVVGFALAIVLYLSRVADAGLELGLGVREIAADAAAATRLASSLLLARLGLALILVVVFGGTALFLLPSPENVVVAVYTLTLLPLAASTRWIHLGQERADAVAVARTAGEVLMLALVLVTVRGPAELARVPLAQVAGDALAASLLLLWLRRRGFSLPIQFDWARVRPLLRRVAPLVASSMLGLLIYNSDLIFLRIFRDRSAVGHYAAAYALISFLINVGIAYSLSLLPTLTRLADRPEAQRELYHEASAQMFAAGMPIAIGGTLLAPAIIGFVFGAEYAPAVIALQLLVWHIPLALVRDMPIIALMSAAREDRVLRITAWAAALNIGLNLALIPAYGIVGAAGATVATEALRMVLALRDASRAGFATVPVRRFWRPALASVVMGGLVLWSLSWGLFAGLAIGVLAYVAVLVLLGAIRIRRGQPPAVDL
jgi:O-antigen/teichoic acid export membrane protein